MKDERIGKDRTIIEHICYFNFQEETNAKKKRSDKSKKFSKKDRCDSIDCC